MNFSLSGLPAMMRPRNRTPNLPAESSSSGTNAVPAVGRRLSLAPPSFLLGANARRRSSVGQRRQLSRRVPRSTSLGARRASRARRRSSIFQSSYMEPPVHPIIMREIPDEELEEEEEESNKKEPKTTHPLRRLSRILSGAGPAFARRVSQLRRKSVALVEGDPELEDLELTPLRYRPIAIDKLSQATKFTTRELKYMYRGFKQECPTGVISEETFKSIYCKFFPLNGQPEDGTGRNTAMYAHYVFGTMDLEGTGHITFGEFIMGLSILLKGSLQERLNWAFNLYDINNDGYITKEELIDIASSIYDLMGDEAHPGIDDGTAVEHVEKVFNKLDLNKDGVVTMDEFMEYCSKNEGIVSSLNIFNCL